MDDGLAGLGKRSALALVAAGVSGAGTIAVLLVVSHTLTVTGAGEFFVAISLFAIVQGLCSFGAETGLQYFVPSMAPDRAQHLIRSVGLVSVGLGIIVGGAVWTFSEPIADLLAEGDGASSTTTGVVSAIAVFLPVAGLYEITMGALRSRDEVVASMFLDRVARPIAQVAGMIAVGITTTGARAIVLAWTMPHVVAVVIAGVMLMRKRPSRHGDRHEDVTHRRYWAYTAPRALARTAQTLTQRLDVLILAAVYPLEEAGIYGTVSRCMIAGVFVSTALRQTIQPQLRRLVIRGDDVAVQGLFGLSTTWLVIVSWPVYIVMITHAPLVMSVFGEGYERGAPALVMLCSAMLVATACGLVDVVLLMLGRSWLSTVNVLLALALNVLLNITLAPQWGMMGSAIAWMAAILTTNLLPLWQTSRRQLTPWGRPLATAIAVAVATVAVPMTAERLLFGTGIAEFAIGLLVASALYAGALWWLRSQVKLDQLVSDLRRPRRTAEPTAMI